MLSKTIVKYIQSLAYKKFRDEHGVFIAEGPKVVTEFLASAKFACKIVFGTKIWMDENVDLVNDIPADHKIEISEIELEKISQLKTPNKVLAVFYKKEENLVDVTGTVSLMLDEIQDPGNMGTIIRTADWFGIKNIICSNECADYYNPKVVQATMGSLARVNIVYDDLERFLKKDLSVKTYAATLSGNNVKNLQKIKDGIIIIGNESKGVSEKVLKLTSEQITITKHGKAESLNAAVACGIILSHIV
ncbi:MAG TPA: RNA methyltransferase [Chitinophagaceae bacterium]|nr:RNA methyltransferase [Chitinophagaceae bacterium]